MIPTTHNDSWIWANWPAPKNVYAGTSTRLGGHSKHPFNQLNLAMYVGDKVNSVNENHRKIIKDLSSKSEPVWLNQQHTARVISLDDADINITADGATTSEPDIVCTVLTADCVPVLICDKAGNNVAVIHAGWKGICRGIVENALTKFPDPSSILVWIGPCISKNDYKAGEDVYSAATTHVNALRKAFEPKKNRKWYCYPGQMIKIILKNADVDTIYGYGLCTYRSKELFYSICIVVMG